MFIYSSKPTDKFFRHKSVKILNLCYLKYDRTEDDEIVNEGGNINNTNSTKSNKNFRNLIHYFALN